VVTLYGRQVLSLAYPGQQSLSSIVIQIFKQEHRLTIHFAGGNGA
jgi:hypothetical protein